MRHAAAWLGWLLLALPGCACDPRPPLDAGADTITCPTIDEELAAAYPSPLDPGELLDSDRRWRPFEGGIGPYALDLLAVRPDGAARVIGGSILFEVRTDGVQTARVELPGRTYFITGTGAGSLGEHEVARVLFQGGTPVSQTQAFQWSRFAVLASGEAEVRDVTSELNIEERFALQRDGTAEDVMTGAVLLHEGSHVWLIRQPRYQDAEYFRTGTVAFVHLIRADGTEPFGPEGMRLRRPVRYEERFENSYEVGADGSLFYLADWAPLAREPGDPPPPAAPDGDRRGPRMVRITPDGTVTISPLLVDTGTITGTESGPNIGGVWSVLDGDGNYLVHFGVQRAGVNSWASVVAKVGPDGTIAWTRMTPEPYTAVLPGPLYSDPPVAYDGEGGVALAMTNGFAPYEIRIGHLDGEGNWLTGEDGMLVESFPPTTDFPDSTLYNLEMDVDGGGGYFVLWAHRGFSDRCLIGATCAMRYDGGGEALWPRHAAAPVDQARPPYDYGTELTIRHDGLGGAWFMTNDGARAALQHLDATGRPLFWYTSRYPPGNWCWRGRLPIVAWPDPDAPPIPYWDGAPYEPRPTVDAGTDAASGDAGLREEDAGVDADLDAG